MTARTCRVGECGPRDEEPLGVGADVRRSEVEAAVFEQPVQQAEVEGGEAFEGLASEQCQAEPKTFAAGAGEEGAAGEALGVGEVG